MIFMDGEPMNPFCRKYVGRTVVAIGWRIQHLQFPLVHQSDPVAHRHGLDLVVSHVDKRLVIELMDFYQLLAGPQAQLGIQVREGGSSSGK